MTFAALLDLTFFTALSLNSFFYRLIIEQLSLHFLLLMSFFYHLIIEELPLHFYYYRASFTVTRIIQSIYYAPAGRYINAWMHSLQKSVKPEIVNRYDLWVLRHKIGGAKVFVNNVQWSDQMM